MRSWNLLLRVMLSLGVILNGSGYASAAAMLPGPGEAPVAAANDTPQTESTAPCPEHGAVTPAQDEESPASSALQDEGRSEYGKPGCCSSTGCIATCLQHAPAPIIAPWFGTGVPSHSVAVRWTDAGHASPVLPDRIRPPIA